MIMPVYVWSGKNRKGVKQKGEMEAPSADTVMANLRRMKITSPKVKEKPKDLLENVAFLQPKVKQKDVILFARQFSTMIDAGLFNALIFYILSRKMLHLRKCSKK
jgi:type IV pilus assembly protein PilC